MSKNKRTNQDLFNELKQILGAENAKEKLHKWLLQALRKAKNEKAPAPNSFEQRCMEIVQDLNDQTGIKFPLKSKNTRALIKSRLNDGFTVEDFRNVHFIKCKSWLHEFKWRKYLTPQTLYRPSNFEKYLQEYKFWKLDQHKNSKSIKTKVTDDADHNEVMQRIQQMSSKKNIK